MRRYCIWFVALFTLAVSCSEEVKPTPYTYTKVFTGEHSKTWKIKFWEQTLNGSVVDTFTVPCSADDLFKFYSGTEHQYSVSTGSNKCNSNPAEDAVINDTWDFVNANATLQIIMPVFDPTTRYPFVVREVTKNGMVLEIFFDQAATESYRIHFDSTTQD